VKDEGPGVDPADLDMIFAPLESMREGRRAGARVDYGMGVGLTISRAIARAYGGELFCHSNREEAGGVFEVTLPLAETSQGEEVN
jgi:signal transduction histidine kinase